MRTNLIVLDSVITREKVSREVIRQLWKNGRKNLARDYIIQNLAGDVEDFAKERAEKIYEQSYNKLPLKSSVDAMLGEVRASAYGLVEEITRWKEVKEAYREARDNIKKYFELIEKYPEFREGELNDPGSFPDFFAIS